jgi:site-specific recombinase XerD
MQESITPEDAVEQYLESRVDIAASTKDKHRYRLNKFLDFAQENLEVDTMAHLRPRHIEAYRTTLLQDDKLNIVTVEQILQTLRVYLRYCERLDYCDDGLVESVIIPNVSKEEESRDIHISHRRAQQIIDHLQKYEYASLNHVVFHLAYHTGLRRGALYGLDLEDWEPYKRALTIRHRDNTPLKLDKEGERNITISDGTLRDALNSYVEDVRADVTDKWDRKPLFASEQGRYHSTTLQKVFYRVTRPCYFGQGCPHDRDIDSCEATHYDRYSKCPSSVSSHPIRRSAITHHLSEDVPKNIVSERMDVTPEVLEQHYDARDKEEKRSNREKYLEDLDDD